MGKSRERGYRDYYCSFILCKSQKRSKLDLTDDTYKSLKVGDTIVIAYSSLDKVWELDEWDFLGAYPCKSNGITQRKNCFLCPVVFMDGSEFGNDYYYYTKLRPDLSLKNFGLNKIILGIDSLLYYKNINKGLDSVWYQCPKELQTKHYHTLAVSLAFYFHGEIIPAEKVFSEIPLAREYYDKYTKN